MLRKLPIILALGALVAFPAAAVAHGHEGGGHGGGHGGHGGGWGGGHGGFYGGWGPVLDYGPDYYYPYDYYGYPGYAPGSYYPGCHLYKHSVIRHHKRVVRWVRACH